MTEDKGPEYEESKYCNITTNFFFDKQANTTKVNEVHRALCYFLKTAKWSDNGESLDKVERNLLKRVYSLILKLHINASTYSAITEFHLLHVIYHILHELYVVTRYIDKNSKLHYDFNAQMVADGRVMYYLNSHYNVDPDNDENIMALQKILNK